MANILDNISETVLSNESQYSVGGLSSCTPLCLEAALRFSYFQALNSENLGDLIREIGPITSKLPHSNAEELLKEIPRYANTLEILKVKNCLATDFGKLLDELTGWAAKGSPVSVILTKPPETIMVHFCSFSSYNNHVEKLGKENEVENQERFWQYNQQFLLFDSHPRPSMNLTGGHLLVFPNKRAIETYLPNIFGSLSESMISLTSSPNFERIQLEMMNQIEATFVTLKRIAPNQNPPVIPDYLKLQFNFFALKEENKGLRQEIKGLKEENKGLKGQNEGLKLKNESLEKEKQYLLDRVFVLEEAQGLYNDDQEFTQEPEEVEEGTTNVPATPPQSVNPPANPGAKKKGKKKKKKGPANTGQTQNQSQGQQNTINSKLNSKFSVLAEENLDENESDGESDQELPNGHDVNQAGKGNTNQNPGSKGGKAKGGGKQGAAGGSTPKKDQISMDEEYAKSLIQQWEIEDSDQNLAKSFGEEEGPTFTCCLCQKSAQDGEKFTVPGCEHEICQDCMKQSFVAQISSGSFPLICPRCEIGDDVREEENNSGAVGARQPTEISKAVAFSLLTFEEQAQYLKLSSITTLASNPVLLKCPQPNCEGWAQNNHPESLEQVCEACEKTWCKDCQASPYHSGITCAQYIKRREKSKGDQENWKKCPSCENMAERSIGCNLLTCKCGNYFCGVCEVNLLSDDRVNPKAHFGNPIQSSCYQKLFT